MGKLTATEVKAALKTPGTYYDGDGLLVKVDPRGGASWKVRVQHEGKRRDFTIGSARIVSLADARVEAARLRQMVRVMGRDPIAERRKAKAASVTFREAAVMFHAVNSKHGRNAKAKGQWLSMMERYAFPRLGDTPVGTIEAPDIIPVLMAVWLSKPETGRRLRQRICATLDYAHARGWRAHEAPSQSLRAGRALPLQPRRDNHRLAMPYRKVPAFLSLLRERESPGRLALEFLILTAARSSEVRGMVWDEIDSGCATWTVPAERMKAGREHVVPLSDAALDVLRRAGRLRRANTDLVFPSAQTGKAMSDMTLLKVLRDAEEPFHVHGFRSSFRDWVSEATTYPREVAEEALAHVNPNKVEAAYRRSNLLEKRRPMMSAWANVCIGNSPIANALDRTHCRAGLSERHSKVAPHWRASWDGASESSCSRGKLG